MKILTYAAAVALARKSSDITYYFNAGDNLVNSVYFCSWRSRLVFEQGGNNV